MFNPLKSPRKLRLTCLGMILGVVLGLTGYAQSQCSNPANAIVAENCLAGNPSSDWDTSPGSAGDLTIQGFATDISVNQGSTVFFKVSTPARAYTIDIYRIGYYGGMGARKVASISPSATLPQTQPACLSDANTGLTDCGNWAVSASWQVPTTATSGVYFAHLTRTDTGGDSHIVFVVRNDSSQSAILYQTSDETWQAYNYYGAGSLYGPGSPQFDLTSRIFKVSYNRPFLTRGFQQEWDTWLFGPEFPMIQWLEQNGYDVTYFTSVDGARNGSLIKNHKIWMDSGHDEYWSAPRRAAVQAARDAGVNLAFFTGNGMFWKTRWENSIDGTNTPNRTLVCYKETLAFAKIDPSDPPTSTGTWRDPTFGPPSDGYQPENALAGSSFMVNGTGADNLGNQTMKVPSADGKMRFWRNTAVASLASNATYTLPLGSLGYEWNEDLDNGFRPAGTFQLSTSTYTLTTDLLLDYGATYGAGSATHHMVLYRAPSGALVFNSGTINWSWGLNSNHDNLFGYQTPSPDPNMQQATVNLFADMGVQPTTLQSGLVPATASTDTTPPTSTITFPTANSTINTGSSVTVTGTATDSGGVVGGVEFSSDGGTTWHPATGRGTWSYSWTPSIVGASTTLLSRAVDDSANLEIPNHGVTVNVRPQTCPCSIWSSPVAPATVDSGDTNSVEVGVKFRADANGSVIGVRFYKAASNTGTHVGHIWSSSGTLLGTATFTGEGASGWQQANFATPVSITANTTYIVSYYAPVGHYSADSYFFAQAGVDNPPLHALESGVDGQNGVYAYPPSGTIGSFPTSNFNSTNYWVDVVYTSSSTYNISGTISGASGAGASVSLTGTEAITTTADLSGNYSFSSVVNGTYAVSASKTGVTFSPTTQSVTVSNGSVTGVNFTASVTNPLSISGTIAGGAGATVTLGGAASTTTTADSSGHYSFTGLLSGSYTITPVENGFVFSPSSQAVTLSGTSVSGENFTAQLCNCSSIWQTSVTPGLVDSADTTPVEVGVKFRADTPGTIAGLRFYKASTNTGTHIGHLWSSSGVLLATATFSNETVSGWQQVTFSTPVQISPNTTYIASYYAPAGHYSADSNYFATAGTDNPPLHALANGVDGPNGIYLYTSNQGGGFPTSTYSSTNYWVDVLYVGTQAFSISGTIAGGAGATVSLGGTGSVVTTADSSGNYSFSGIVAGSYSVTPALSGAVFVPGSQNVTVASASVTGVNFTVPKNCPCDTIWQPATLPGTIDSADTQSYELGVKFRADSDGYVLGVRFYKASANTGTHVGNLWANPGTGNPLSTATFSNESASGWQQVMFANPVPVTANTTYIASYFAPAGHYSADNSFFASAGVDTPPLHALATGIDGQNGVFTQSSTSVFPSSSFEASNYWVDVIYATATTHSIGGVITGTGVAGVTITLSGASTATTTSDSFGNYSFSGLADGSYTVAASKSGSVFSPGTQAVTLNGAHDLSVNFAASQLTYSVSGTVSGGPGITVSLTGSAVAPVTTDVSGNYSFPAVPNGTYTVTPSGVGFTSSPTSQNVTVNGANVGAVNFTATAIAYSISGSIAGGAGATVSLTGTTSATTTADSSGNYSFPDITSGSYVVTPGKAGSVFTPTSLSVAVAGANVSSVNFSVPQTCPCDTIWQPSATPVLINSQDQEPVELGVKFRSDSNGVILGVRFYKSTANVGVHQGNLWTSTGTLLATATFTNEGSSGWQQVFFSTPVPVTANTTYIASYFAPDGDYSGDTGFFLNSGVDTAPLHALANGTDGSNGVYLYSSVSGFPTSSFNAANYWVDVIYSPTFTITGTITGAGGAGATINLSGQSNATTIADASGNYSFSSITNGSYTVTPSNTGYVFAPVSQNITVNSSNIAVPSFTASVQSFSITGTITGSGGNGAKVNLTGAATGTTTANASGLFTFSGLANGSYAVTPSLSGFSYTPPNQAVTINGANASVSFASQVQTYTISGTISGTGGNGATVTLSGTSSASTTANASGTYSFTVTNGSYSVKPTKAGFAFTPVSQAITVNGANTTANFSSAATFTISGTISGAGGNGATVNLAGAATATTTASSSGAYSFTVVNGAYTVTPTKAGFAFTPASTAVTVSGANKTANFSSATTFTISGTISGPGGNGATVNLTGATTATTTANASGAYSFTVANGSYTVTPSKTGFIFTPASTAVTVSGANKTANFSSVQTFTISGTISGTGGNGATVKLTGATTATTTASAAGVYSFTVVNGSYTVTASKTGFIFTPGSTAVTVSGANQTANFSSSQTFTISGTVSGAGASGATVKLTGAATATVTTSLFGAYTFTGIVAGAYTVTPTKVGRVYTPTSQPVTVTSSNVTGLNFTSR